MAWKSELKASDGTWDLSGPVGDTLIMLIECIDVLPNHDWTDWAFSGVVRGVGTISERQDLGTTAEELHKEMILTETTPMEEGNEYGFAIRGIATIAGLEVKETWWTGVVRPLANPMEEA